MREAVNVTVKYQFLRLLLTQAAASGIAFVFAAIAFWYFTNINILKEILSLAFMLVNFILLFIDARKYGAMDIKPYTSLKPSILKGAAMGAFIAAVNVLFALVYKLLWAKFGVGENIEGALPTAYNAFFFLWSYPYNGFMNLRGGSFTFYTWIFMIALPLIAILSGYITGIKKIDVMEKIDSLAYEKDEE